MIRSDLHIVAFVDDGFTNLLEKILNSLDVLIGTRLDRDLTVGHFLLQAVLVVLWHRSIVCQILFVSDHDTKHALLVFDMLSPIKELIVGSLVVNRVAQHGTSGAFHEEMRNIVHLGITCSIPNAKSQLMGETLRVLDFKDMHVVISDVGVDFLLPLHGLLRQERIDDGGFAYLRISHKNDLRFLFACNLSRG